VRDCHKPRFEHGACPGAGDAHLARNGSAGLGRYSAPET